MRGAYVPTLRRVVFLVVALLAVGVAGAQVPSRNVNIVSGSDWPGGDPFLQRQNEPSTAVSTRNPMHLMAGANDYRTVDLPGFAEDRETGDAWLSAFTSYDGGATWRSTLLPGYPQQAGSSSPLFGYEAGADPTVRAGTNGLFYYSGIVFDRDNPVLLAQAGNAQKPALAGVGSSTSAVFVARYIDDNHKENAESIGYLGTSIVSSNASDPDAFLDKPWLAVDIPRKTSGECVITQSLGGATVTQSIQAGNVYVAFSRFRRQPAGDFTGELVFSRSTDCGVTWSTPILISAGHRINQGASVAIDPRTGTVYVVWRRFAWPRPPATATQSDAILVARSLDNGRSFNPPEAVAALRPFDQGTDLHRFRTNAYPSVAVDRSGRVYVVFSTRGLTSTPDARIAVTHVVYPSRARVRFSDEDDTPETPVRKEPQATWSTPVPIDPDLARRGHQIMPTALVTSERLQVAWIDLREDHTWGEYLPDSRGVLQETRMLSDERKYDPANVFNSSIDDATVTSRRHTADVFVAQSAVGSQPAFTIRRISSYRSGVRPDQPETIQQLQFNPPNLPLFKLGSAAFWGDYIDIGALSFDYKNRNKWRHAPKSDSSFVVFTDNRDVRPPLDGRWDLYTPPVSPALKADSIYQPGTPTPSCDGAHTERAGMRNQNIYAARVSQGLVVGVPGNAKPLGRLQRAFVVFVENTTYGMKTFRLTLANQPTGGTASFRQFAMLTTIDVVIGPRSSISRAVYVSSSDQKAAIDVSVQETSGGAVLPPASGGLEGLATINPDMTNPDMTNPDMTNPDMTNADVLNVEVHTPDMTNPDMTNPDMTNPDMTNPDMTNPDMTNPDMTNPDLVSLNPTSADVLNSAMTNTDLVNPDMTNPDMTNPSMSDTIWTVTNLGNTTSAYDIQLLLRNTTVPSGFKTQLILYKTYTTPIAKDCQLRQETQNVLIANIPNPTLLQMGSPIQFDPADGSLQHATLWLAPGESAKVALRVLDPDKNDDVTFDPIGAVAAAAVPQAVDSDDAAAGVTQPVPVTSGGPLLSFERQPSTTPIGGFVAPPVRIWLRDDSGAGIAGETITLSLASGPPGATLHGATAVTGADGLASFPALWLDRIGVHKLRATAAGTNVESMAFAVVALIVTTTSDTGPGSLREAIENANRNAGYADAISFDIPGAGPHTIAPLTALPVVADPLTIDGTTQPGYAGSPVVELNGAATTAGPGLHITGGGTTVRGLAVNRFGLVDGASGIMLLGGSGSVIQGNFIGTDLSGNLARPNNEGILIATSSDNLIGGTAPSDRNVIAGNLAGGINISNHLSAGNHIVGNYIGTDANGTAGLSTGQFGVYISNAPNNVVGGSATGAGNVIAASTFNGIRISGSTATGNQILGNRIGTNASGTAALGNTQAGIWLGDGSSGTVIGGTEPGQRNLVSGNAEGIRILGSHHNTAEGNYVGTNAAGGVAIGNTGVAGVWIAGDDNTLRGNLISGNTSWGVQLIGGSRNRVEANFIGTNAAGTGSMPNAGGVSYSGDARADHTIHNNLVSGNTYYGIWLTGADHIFITGNKIGTTVSGDGPLPNGSPSYASRGLEVDGCISSRIGGGSPGDGNLVSGNLGDGILLRTYADAGFVDCAVQSNVVGTDAGGLHALPNTGVGVRVSPSLAPAAPMSGFLIDQNLISGNVLDGVSIENGVHHLTVSRNTIGTDAAGNSPLPNGGSGVSVFGDVHDVVIGGAGASANLISGNTAHGVVLVAPSAPGTANNEVSNNLIGTSRAGTLALGNGMMGVVIAGLHAHNNRIAGNLVSGNRFSGLSIAGDAHDNVVVGNRIGTTADGTGPLPNLENGVYLAGDSNRIGGSAPGEGNLISANGGCGIASAGDDTQISANKIGTNLAGTAALGNAQSGLCLGGSGITVRDNLISGNLGDGIWTAMATMMTIVTNRVGTDETGTSGVPNQLNGIYAIGSGISLIGGTTAAEGNTIAFNVGAGIAYSGWLSGGSAFASNGIFSNGGLGIDLGGDGVTLNDLLDDDIGPNDLLNFPVLTSAVVGGDTTTVAGSLNSYPNGQFTIQFFSSATCDPSGYGEGERLEGSTVVTTDAGGNASFAVLLPSDLSGRFVTATTVTSIVMGGRTSEFSACIPVSP